MSPFPTSLVKPGSELETVIASSGMPPEIKPKSPIGLHSKLGANPPRHLQ